MGYHSPRGQHCRKQAGFTLIEVLVALVIFAMLAVSGWQIMDSISKSRDRTNIQLNQLSQLQYAYLQLSQDFAQVTNYVIVPIGLANQPTNQSINQINTQSVGQTGLAPTFSLSNNSVNFIRFASPDPRLNPPPILARVTYQIDGNKLVKQRAYINGATNLAQPATSSVLLTEIDNATWTALTPETVTNFPDSATLQKVQQFQQQTQQATQPATSQPATSASSTASSPKANSSNVNIDTRAFQQLPKGVQISFNYHGQPVTWRFALPSQTPNPINTLANVGTSPAPNGNASTPMPNPSR